MKPTLTFLSALLLVSLATLDAADSARNGTVPAYPPVFQTDAPYRFSGLESRAVTQENPTGAKGMGGKDRGNGNLRKGAPAFRNVRPGETKTLCDIEGPGMVRHIWITVADRSPVMLRNHIVRIYWDDSPHPSVEVPLGDLFGVAHGRTASFMTPPVGMPEGNSFHCYFPMFRRVLVPESGQPADATAVAGSGSADAWNREAVVGVNRREADATTSKESK